MAAAYDTYDYPSYWEGREYEHQSEVNTLTQFIKRIESINKITDLGAGFGRLTPVYRHRAKKIVLIDPSAKLLSLAKERLGNEKIQYVQSKIETLPSNLKINKSDLVIFIRVAHHIKNIDNAIKTVDSILDKNGYFIIEFANKQHIKATLTQFIKGNLTFPIEILPIDIRSKKAKKEKTLPFLNYHPDDIVKKLEDANFKIILKKSTSNIRSPFLKKYLPLEFLLLIDSLLQFLFSKINFGPSIFILAKKRG